MTRNLTVLKLAAVSTLCLSLSACQTAPQNGVVKTDLAGSMSQMWSNVFSGELRGTPSSSYNFGQQSQYAFGGTDATLNTNRLAQRVALQDRPQQRPTSHASYGQSHYNAPPQAMSQDYVQRRVSTPRLSPTPSTQKRSQFMSYQDVMPNQNWAQQRVQERGVITPENVQAMPPKRSFGAKMKSIFKPKYTSEKTPLSAYETFESRVERPNTKSVTKSAALARPAQSQPVIDTLAVARDAYPTDTRTLAPSPSTYDIPPRASINENLKTMGRRTAAIDPIASTTSHNPTANWQAANQEIGDSLSYVKMGGGSQIADWQACEKQAGQYFQTTATGFIVDPAFDRCMRTSGYKPEAEAQSELELSAN